MYTHDYPANTSIKRYYGRFTPSGANGAATVTANFPKDILPGFLYGFLVKTENSPAATIIQISDTLDNTNLLYLNLTTGGVDESGFFPVVVQTVENDGTDATGHFAPYLIPETTTLRVFVDDADSDTVVEIWVYMYGTN